MRQQIAVFIIYYSSSDSLKELGEEGLISLPMINVLSVTLDFSKFGKSPHSVYSNEILKCFKPSGEKAAGAGMLEGT